jgi:hypothetical protein
MSFLPFLFELQRSLPMISLDQTGGAVEKGRKWGGRTGRDGSVGADTTMTRSATMCRIPASIVAAGYPAPTG